MNEWYEGLRPRTERLSERVGATLFHYEDPDCDTDDDLAHRYLALDYVCHMVPHSPFVEYLRKVAGAGSLDALRSALLDPAAYGPEFVLFDAFNGIEAWKGPVFEWREGVRAADSIASFPKALE